MKIETLRKSHKKQIVLGVLIICVIGVISLLNIIKEENKTLLIKDNNINNLTSTKLAVNISEDGTNYEIANEIPTSGYKLNEEKSVCKVQTETSGIENAPIDRSISIEYTEGKVNFLGVGKRNTRCYLYFDKYVPPITIPDIIASFGSRLKAGNPDFTKTATGAETVADNGIYKTLDPMYGENAETYYWRGAATTNHVIFANKCWRIVRINGDGSIRLIYNGTPSGTSPNQTCPGNGSNSGSIAVTSQRYNASYNNSAYVGYTYTASVQRPTPTTGGEESNLKTRTETWYNNNIGNNATYASHVADGKYCNDRTVGSGTWSATGSTFNYGAYTRLIANKTPTLECDSQDVYTLKAGAITADEVAYVGGVAGSSNSSYYLYNGAYYWTMSPSYWNSSSARVFRLDTAGSLNNNNVNLSSGVRPVINLKSNTEFAAGGEGTQSNPYVVNE